MDGRSGVDVLNNVADLLEMERNCLFGLEIGRWVYQPVEMNDDFLETFYAIIENSKHDILFHYVAIQVNR